MNETSKMIEYEKDAVDSICEQLQLQTQMHETAIEQIVSINEKIRELENEKAILLADVKKYGQHLHWCDAKNDATASCSCGYRAKYTAI